jgi:hypothetical protein
MASDPRRAILARFDAALRAHRRATDALTIEAAALRAALAGEGDAADPQPDPVTGGTSLAQSSEGSASSREPDECRPAPWRPSMLAACWPCTALSA